MQSPSSKASMQSHMLARQALLVERQSLLQQQSAVLQEHMRAGLPLPGTKRGVSSGTEQRQQLIAQLVQEEAAAGAALEALKQGSSLARAREAGERVMQQARDLQLSSSTAAALTAPAGTAAAAGGAAGSLVRQRLQSVLLHTAAGAAAGEQGGRAKSARVGAGTASAARQQQQQHMEQLSSQSSLQDELPVSHRQQQTGQFLLQSPHSQQQPLSKQHRQRSVDFQQQQQQQQYSPGVQHHLSPSVHQQQQGPTPDFLALQQQMAMLQNMLASQQLLQQQQQHAAALQLPQPPAAAGYGLPSPGSGPFYAQPQYSLYPGGLQSPVLLSPAAAGGAGGVALGGAFGASYPGQHPSPAAAAAAATGKVSGGGDAALTAAVAAHMRDMTLLRMDVERTRGNAELQQARSELAALQRGGGAAAAAAGGSGGDITLLEPAGDFSSFQQQQQQQQQPGYMEGQQQDCGPGVSASGSDTEDDDDGNDGDDSTTHGMSSNAAAGAAAAAAGRGGSSGRDPEQEVLLLRPDGVLAAARGSGGKPDVLQVHVTAAGPFTKRGTYRVAVVLYDGFQPMAAGPGCQVTASTGRRAVAMHTAVTATPPGDGATPAGAASGRFPSSAAAAATDPAAAAAAAATAATAAPPGIARFQESLSIKGLRLSASIQLVFELYCAKPSVAGLPTKELLVAWAATPLLQGGQVLPGLQSLPLLRLPIMLTPDPVRHWSYEGALIDFRLARYAGAPGDIEQQLSGTPGGSRGLKTPGGGVNGGSSSSSSSGHEDLPGVPAEAWVRVSRGLLPAEPYTQGDGIVVVVDGARFLPASTTISRVLASVWSSSGVLLAGPFEGVAHPSSDALSPVFMCKATLDAAQNNSTFDDPTATLLLQVHTIERSSRALRVVGFSLLALFLDPRGGGQPLSRSTTDYVLNSGAFQVPLHADAPPTTTPLRMSSLDNTPRVACSSMLVRIMTPEAAKAQRRKPPPQYGDRVYDSVLRCMPTALERKLYGRLLAARQPWAVREAARLVAWYRRQPGGLTGRRGSTSSSSSGDGSSRRSTADASNTSRAYGTSQQQQQQLKQGIGVQAPSGGDSSGGGGGGLLQRLFGGMAGGEAAEGGSGALLLNTGDTAAAIPERQEDLEAAKAELLPPKDGDIIDWMSEAMRGAEAAATAGGSADLSFVNFNLATQYLPELDFYVAVDGAMRLARPLPAACIISTSPPGSMYQDHPMVDDVRLTLDYDLDAPLSAPRWLDGYQAFTGIPHHPGLVLLLDVRCLVPGSSTAAPAGWACLPVFEAAGPFVASGVYHLPLFQGIPSHQLLTELTEGGNPDAVMAAAIAAGRARPSLDCSSVCVRLVCGSRQGQLEAPSWSIPLPEQRLTRHTVSELGPGFVAEMRRPLRTRTYAQAKPKALTDEQWVDQINDTLLKISGLDEQMNQDGRDD